MSVSSLPTPEERAEALIAGMVGPVSSDPQVIIEGRAIPRLTMRDEGDEICIILDSRLAFPFPRSLAYQAASLAANALAIGAGFPFAGADEKCGAFAPKAAAVDLRLTPADAQAGDE